MQHTVSYRMHDRHKTVYSITLLSIFETINKLLDTHLVPNAVTRLISRQRNLINQVASSLKNAKSVTQKNSVAAWGKPCLPCTSARMGGADVRLTSVQAHHISHAAISRMPLGLRE